MNHWDAYIKFPSPDAQGKKEGMKVIVPNLPDDPEQAMVKMRSTVRRLIEDGAKYYINEDVSFFSKLTAKAILMLSRHLPNGKLSIVA